MGRRRWVRLSGQRAEGSWQIADCRTGVQGQAVCRDEGLTDPSWVEGGAQDRMLRSS